MKNIIAISLVVSTFLVGANVNNLVDNKVNSIRENSIINNTSITQGNTQIVGDSYIDTLTIDQSSNIEAGNLVENSTLDGADIKQGTTSVTNSRVINLGLESDSNITLSTITGGKISQGSFIITDSNATDSEATNINLKATNLIDETTSDDSNIKQSYTIIGNGSDVSNLDITQQNSIQGSIFQQSDSTQGVIEVDNSHLNGLFSLHGFEENVNKIEGTVVENYSITKQNEVSLQNGADILTFKNGSHNSLKDSLISQSNLFQNSILVDDSSVESMEHYRKNEINNLNAYENSTIIQNRVNIALNSDVKDFKSNRLVDNKIESLTAFSSTIAQNDVDIVHGDIDGLDIGQKNSIVATTTDGSADSNMTSSNITQGKVLIRDTQAQNILESGANGSDFFKNSISDIDIEDSTISQGDLISYESHISNITTQGDNSASNLDMDNSSLTQGKILINGY